MFGETQRGFKSRPLRHTSRAASLSPSPHSAKCAGLWYQKMAVGYPPQPFAFLVGSGIISSGRARWGASGAFTALAVPEIRSRGVEFPNEGLARLSLPRSSGVEDRVLRGRSLRTPPGPEGSNGKEILLGAAGSPGWSRLAEESQARKFDAGCTTISWNVTLIDRMYVKMFLTSQSSGHRPRLPVPH